MFYLSVFYDIYLTLSVMHAHRFYTSLKQSLNLLAMFFYHQTCNYTALHYHQALQRKALLCLFIAQSIVFVPFS